MDSARLQAELLSHNMKLFLMPGCNTWPAFDTQLDARERDLSTASEEVASARSRSASCQQAREQLQEAVLQLESKLATSTAEVQALRTQLQVRGQEGRLASSNSAPAKTQPDVLSCDVDASCKRYRHYAFEIVLLRRVRCRVSS